MKEPTQTIISQVERQTPKASNGQTNSLPAERDLAVMLDFSAVDKGECKGCTSNIPREICLQAHQTINYP